MVDFKKAAKEEAKQPDTSFDPGKIQEEKFEEVGEGIEPAELGEFVKFNTLGDSITGLYEAKRSFQNQFGKQQTAYDIRTADGLFSINGNADLNNRMAKVRVKSYLRITYVSDHFYERADLSPMRIFKVEVSKSVTQNPDTGGVTRKSPFKPNPDALRKG